MQGWALLLGAASSPALTLQQVEEGKVNIWLPKLASSVCQDANKYKYCNICVNFCNICVNICKLKEWKLLVLVEGWPDCIFNKNNSVQGVKAQHKKPLLHKYILEIVLSILTLFDALCSYLPQQETLPQHNSLKWEMDPSSAGETL